MTPKAARYYHTHPIIARLATAIKLRRSLSMTLPTLNLKL